LVAEHASGTVPVRVCVRRPVYPRAMSDSGPFLAVQTESDDPTWFEIERKAIEAAGGRLLVQEAKDEEDRVRLLQDAQAVLVSRADITRQMLERLPKLRLIVRYGVGLETLDIPAATDH